MKRSFIVDLGVDWCCTYILKFQDSICFAVLGLFSRQFVGLSGEISFLDDGQREVTKGIHIDFLASNTVTQRRIFVVQKGKTKQKMES